MRLRHGRTALREWLMRVLGRIGHPASVVGAKFLQIPPTSHCFTKSAERGRPEVQSHCPPGHRPTYRTRIFALMEIPFTLPEYPVITVIRYIARGTKRR
jgi:hypothetical protein